MNSNINYINGLTEQIMTKTTEIASVSGELDLKLLLMKMKEREELVNELFSLDIEQDFFGDVVKKIRESDALTTARLKFVYEDVKKRLNKLNNEKKIEGVYSCAV